jgi:UDP-glucose 4-epimerase
MKILITGGAGYIGSHAVKALGKLGHKLLIYDNLSTGHKEAVLYGDLINGDLADRDEINAAMNGFRPDMVLHFAASIQVEESVHEPLMYYRNNVANSLNLLDAMLENNIGRLVYSSTAAVYGIPSEMPVREDAPLFPISPYGASKVMVETVLRDLAATKGIQYVSLRYFNVAGADPEGRLGQVYRASTHLITRALKAAHGELAQLSIYGTDYQTIDGTCIRDYIHVTDLADAHVQAVEYLMSTGATQIMNCGYGHGYSVREVVNAVKKITGKNFTIIQTVRRAGDPPVLLADSGKLRQLTGWTPRHDEREFIVKTAWEWELKVKKAGGSFPKIPGAA